MNFIKLKNISWQYVLVLLIVVGISNPTTAFSPKPKRTKSSIPHYSNRYTEQKLDEIPISVDYKFNTELRKEIIAYTLRARNRTERTLGRSALYFPIFEKYIEKYNLPKDLIALPIIESALNPQAISPVGAGGLWQFMPQTARLYGLEINDYVDERWDPVKSTEAAMKHLVHLYDIFEDWTLAISAYNCGSGRVNDAIRKAKSRDYWKVRKHLPKETQKYIVRYVAANYMLNYYLFYDLHPQFLDYNLVMTEQIQVTDFYTFRQISRESGISIETIQYLNPSYKKNRIPADPAGNVLILPKIGRAQPVQKILAKNQ